MILFSRPSSLRQRLLLGLLLPLIVLIGINAWWSYGRAIQVANESYDRSLYLAARTLAEELTWDQGQLNLDVLRGVGYLFENHTGARLFYRVDSINGKWLAGNPSVPRLTPSETPSVAYFSLVQFGDLTFLDTPVRAAELIHVVDTNPGESPMLVITVVETREARDLLTNKVIRETLLGQGVLLAAVALLMIWGIQRGIRPLDLFRRRLEQRQEADFSAIDPPDVPKELRPLIAALNSYLSRLGRLIEIRKRFLDNAAHQLRTPLTILKTQLSLSQRAAKNTESLPLIEAAIETTNQAVELTEQLLSLTRAEHAHETHAREEVDLVALAQEVTQERLIQAHEQGADLGFERLTKRYVVCGIRLMLHEALANLMDNALEHGLAHVRVTVRVGPGWVEVEDDGPGIAAEHQAHVFERFYQATAPGRLRRRGSGLGLAIVREIALQHNASVQLTSPTQGPNGTRIRIAFNVTD